MNIGLIENSAKKSKEQNKKQKPKKEKKPKNKQTKKGLFIFKKGYCTIIFPWENLLINTGSEKTRLLVIILIFFSFNIYALNRFCFVLLPLNIRELDLLKTFTNAITRDDILNAIKPPPPYFSFGDRIQKIIYT